MNSKQMKLLGVCETISKAGLLEKTVVKVGAINNVTSNQNF